MSGGLELQVGLVPKIRAGTCKKKHKRTVRTSPAVARNGWLEMVGFLCVLVPGEVDLRDRGWVWTALS